MYVSNERSAAALQWISASINGRQFVKYQTVCLTVTEDRGPQG